MLIPTNASGILGRGVLLVRKFSPEILTVSGLASMTAGAIMAVKATTKLERVIRDAELRISDAKDISESTDVETSKHGLSQVYLRNAFEYTKLYGPSVSLFIAGAGAILAAHGIMRRRNVALVAAYNAVEKSFAAYRARVIEDLGEEKDRDYRHGIIEKTEKGEDGKKSSTLEIDPTKMSRYSRVFDEGNPMWQKEPNYNQFFLTSEQNYINNKLLAVGHVFLNEVYERLGFEHTKEGSVVGWIVSPDGDNYIDFGVYDASTQSHRNFINGYERSIWLDFNVDGVIFDKI